MSIAPQIWVLSCSWSTRYLNFLVISCSKAFQRSCIAETYFSQRVIYNLNNLPQHVVDSNSLIVFKKRLDQYMDTSDCEDMGNTSWTAYTSPSLWWCWWWIIHCKETLLWKLQWKAHWKAKTAGRSKMMSNRASTFMCQKLKEMVHSRVDRRSWSSGPAWW